MTDEALLERYEQNERDRQARRRRKKRATKSPTLTETKPWESEGVSRRTWYRRRRKPAGTKRVRHNTVSLITDGICATTPPAIAVGTPKKSIRLVRVEGEALVGGPSRKWKTRFPTAMRLSKEQKAYALEAGFEPEKIQRMFEIFRDLNIAQRCYSTDWGEVWFNWVDREIQITNEWYDRERRRRFLVRCG